MDLVIFNNEHAESTSILAQRVARNEVRLLILPVETYDGLYGLKEFCLADGFDEISRNADFLTAAGISAIGRRCQHDDCRFRFEPLSNLLRETEAVHLRHLAV